MFTDFLFHGSAIVVLPFWFAMIAFPRADWTGRMIATPWIILPPVVCYLLLGLPHVAELVGAFGEPSPENLAAIMSQPWAASLFWAYAGAFDLFVGRWMFLDAQERGFSPVWVSPVLFITIFFGPLGFLLYGGMAIAVLVLSRRRRRR